MSIPHTKPAFDFMGYLTTNLTAKREARAGLVRELERMETFIIKTDKEIVEIEAAILKMETP